MRRRKLKFIIAGVLVLAGVGFLSAILIADSSKGIESQPLQSVPGHLDILSATIEVIPPVYIFNGPDDVPGREVVLRMELASDPTCSAVPSFLGYCFLIDSDKSSLTGTTHAAFGDLGIDARICAECDTGSSVFVPTIGTLTITVDPGTGVTTLEIATTIDQLPSIDFHWIAAAQEDWDFVRLPALPDFGHWTTMERSMH